MISKTESRKKQKSKCKVLLWYQLVVDIYPGEHEEGAIFERKHEYSCVYLREAIVKGKAAESGQLITQQQLPLVLHLLPPSSLSTSMHPPE